MRKSLIALVFLAFCRLLVAQQALDNDAIIKLVKAGLSDDLIVTTINTSAGTYNTSVDGIIALKTAGVSDKVVSAVVAKASAVAAAASAPIPPLAPMPVAADQTAAPSPTAGIDEVGVYYKDNSGAWSELMPEVVNFKSGGVMKSILSDGIVKGDLNGHIVGAHSRNTVTFPVVIAVYVPEGTAITEYQLLRLRKSGGSREFRSVTGGVFHVTGGATRDVLDFASQKIAPRVYQITLDSSLGRGEYGLLPPGSSTSSNIGSAGKLYSVSVPE